MLHQQKEYKLQALIKIYLWATLGQKRYIFAAASQEKVHSETIYQMYIKTSSSLISRPIFFDFPDCNHDITSRPSKSSPKISLYQENRYNIKISPKITR